MMGPQTRPGAAVRCLAENPLGVATAENTEMRIRGLEQRLGQLEERARTGARLLEDIGSGQQQIRDMVEATEQLEPETGPQGVRAWSGRRRTAQANDATHAPPPPAAKC